ncbi:MAG: 23S rRNA (guanosine(2251)-2'-O)-methyltransferase RlmB [Microthrixaceae bacterium]
MARGSGPPRSRAQKRPEGLDGTQVEGRQSVRELLLAGRRKVHEVYLGNDVEEREIVEDILGLAAELRVPVRRVARSKLDHMARTDSPQGVVARAQRLPSVDLDGLCRERDGNSPFLVALDGVTDPGNLGALLRIAECAGVTGVVLPRHRSARITPTVTKAAAGAVEHLAMAQVAGMPAAIEQMRSAGVWVVGLDAGGATSIHELPVAGEAVCLVLGAEGRGLSRLVTQRCDLVASIPLHGHLASLNVSAAGAIACYEVARRRS